MVFTIEVLETLSRTLTIEAYTEQEALDTAKQLYANETVVLDSADFQGVDFNIKPVL